MEGLKAIAQSTFDKLQQFRPSGGGGAAAAAAAGGGGGQAHNSNNNNNNNNSSGEGDSGPYRYNVIEIGVFGPAPSPASSSLVSSPGLKRQPSSSTPNPTTTSAASRQSVNGGSTPAGGNVTGGGGNSGSSGSSSASAVRRVTLNEWMVFEDDLAAFMKKRPVDYVTVATTEQDHTNSKKGSSKSQASTRKEEVEAIASLKLVCIQRIDPNDDDQDDDDAEYDDDDDYHDEQDGPNGYHNGNGHDNEDNGHDDDDDDDYRRHLREYQRRQHRQHNPPPPRLQPETNTLAISRDTFLRLYVTCMDGDHSALYYLAREYDGFLEFHDAAKGITTKYVGTADYALLWTFNRRTLETRGLFIDRCQHWQAKDSFPFLTVAMHGPAEPPRRRSTGAAHGDGLGIALPRASAQRTSSTIAHHPDSPPVTPVTPSNNNANAHNRSSSRQLYTHLEHNAHGNGSGPPTSASSRFFHDASSVHSTPSRRWTKNRTGSVTASEAWRGFRETLSIYRGYVFVPQLLSYVSVVHMLRTFDDQVNDEDLPLIKGVETTLAGNVQRNYSNLSIGSGFGGRNPRMRQSSRAGGGGGFDGPGMTSSFYGGGSPSAARYARGGGGRGGGGGSGGEDGRHTSSLQAAASRISSIMLPSQATDFSLVSDQASTKPTKHSTHAPTTSPAQGHTDKKDQEDHHHDADHDHDDNHGHGHGHDRGPTPQQAARAAQASAQATAQAQAAAITALAARDKLLAQALLLSRVDTSIANKRRHLDLARQLLEVLAHEHETLLIDVVAPLYLDRYHRAMEALTEAVPALERHISSLDDYLRYLKGRAETLSGLVQ